MNVRRVVANERVAQIKNMVALEYGPIVYCVEGIDNDNNTFSIRLPDNLPLNINHDKDMLGGVNVITGKTKVSNETITAIPYYVWSNRGIGTMRVWLPRVQSSD